MWNISPPLLHPKVSLQFWSLCTSWLAIHTTSCGYLAVVSIWKLPSAYGLRSWVQMSMQLCALVSNKSCSSAWTLEAQVDDNAAFVNGFEEYDDLGITVVAAEGVIFLPVNTTSTWTENSEYTGLWSENLDSPRTYHICFRLSPFHRILSHLFSYHQILNTVTIIQQQK